MKQKTYQLKGNSNSRDVRNIFVIYNLFSILLCMNLQWSVKFETDVLTFPLSVYQNQIHKRMHRRVETGKHNDIDSECSTGEE